jgi:FtsP/CotA-like multicopper oxidase with cupredoxin domain
VSRTDAPAAESTLPRVSGEAANRDPALSAARPLRQRRLYFSESHKQYFITVDGVTPEAFDMNFKKPNITVRQGTIEDWTVENRAREAHVFHIHQLHFLVLERDGKPVKGQYRDMINVPYWTGTGPYPSVKLRMDFRGPDIGDFVYHCHILGHEDSGMMAIIRVLPKP